MKRILSLLLLCALCLSAGAQKSKTQDKITTLDAASMPSQLLELMNQSTKQEDKQKACTKMIQGFVPVYNALDARSQERVTAIYNTMIKLRVRPLPDLYDFTEALMRFRAGSPANFSAWIDCIEFLQGRNKRVKDVTEFVEFADNLQKDRTLCKTSAALWQTQAGVPFSLRQEGKEILVEFSQNMELYYSSNRDYGTIYGTSGTYYYFDNRWVGRGGRVNWDRTGIPSAQCYATLSRYEAVTKFPKFSADSAQFVNTKYFDRPIYGRIDEALSSRMEPDKYTYPKFRSYQKDFQMKNVLQGVDYEGSFMMNGAKFVTTDEKNPATMVFYRNGQRFITVKSTKFTISSSRLLSERASVRIYIDGDSICNDGVLARYVASDKKVTLINDRKRNYYSPYSDSYHNLDVYSEQIVWHMDKDQLEFSMLGQGSETFSTFESGNYYSARKMREMQGIDETSPVIRVYNYMRSRGMAYDFFIDEFALYLHLDIMQAKNMIHTLAGSGLASYDEATGHVYIKDRLLDYAKAHNKARDNDYDAITLESTAKGSNAVINLANNDMQIQGVKKFVVSDSQAVAIYPARGSIVVKKNRDMNFSGRINAGRFIMFVTDAEFSYDQFRLNLPKIDSVYFFVKRFDDPNKEQIVNTPLYNLVGSIDIDMPDNHCGLKKNKDYPIFHSTENSFVYYDRKDIFNGTYVRDRFYYTLHPFTLNRLSDFETDSLQFLGALTSAGIFPEIVQPLTVQPDYSLGFVIETPQGGFDAYGGKGRYTHTVDLSYSGFRGRGTVDYLTSTTRSQNIYFMPDSMLAATDTFFVREEGGFPDIQNGRTMERWYPYQDSMQVTQLAHGTPFSMFHGQTLLAGSVVLRPQGAAASGRALIREGMLESSRFTLASNEMDARVSTFSLRSDLYKTTAFYATNMKSHVDYTQRRADFTSNTPLGRTTLPVMNYAAYVDKFSWQMDRQELDLINSHSEDDAGMGALALSERVGRPQPGARFVQQPAGKTPLADSLVFYALRGSYHYNTAQLSAHGVFRLDVADASIAPNGDSLFLSQGGDIKVLNHAQLLFSRDSAFHLAYDANLLVDNARHFSGNGAIDFVDEYDKHQKISLTDIQPDASGMTVANGFIDDNAHFTLNNALGFAGKVRIRSDHSHYYFDGGVRLIHKCVPAQQLGLLAYADYLDPRNIQVSVPQQPTDWKGNPITAAVLFNRSSLAPFSAFLTSDRPADNQLLTAWGKLTYNSADNRYIITSEEKLEDFETVVAPYLTLNTQTCELSGEGPLNLGVRDPNLFAYGSALVHPSNEASHEFVTLFGVNFPIASNIVETMAQLIADDLRLSPANPDNEILRHALIRYLGDEQGEEQYSTYVSTGSYDRQPHEFDQTILFERIPWQYSTTMGYYYDGVAPLASVGKKQLHLDTRLKAQIYHRGNATYLTLYIQVASDHWYYFNYETSTQTLVLYSSVGEWMDLIKALPADKRSVDKFHYRAGTNNKEVSNFLLKFGHTDSDFDSDDDSDE